MPFPTIPMMYKGHTTCSGFIDKLKTHYPEKTQRLIQRLSTLECNKQKLHVSTLTPLGSPWEINHHFHKKSLIYTIDPMSKGDFKKLVLPDQFGSQCQRTFSHSPPLVSFREESDGSHLKVYYQPQSGNHPVTGKIRNLLSEINTIGKLMLVGYDTNQGVPEFYYKLRRCSRKILHQMLDDADKSKHLPWLLDQWSYLSSLSILDFFDSISLGISLTESSTNRITCTFFLHATELFSSNEETIHKISTLAKDLNQDTELYHELTEGALTHQIQVPIHSVIGFKLTDENLPRLSAGIAPH